MSVPVDACPYMPISGGERKLTSAGPAAGNTFGRTSSNHIIVRDQQNKG